MEWKIKRFEELTNEELYNIIKERINIFVVEQDCPYPELDGKDAFAFHLFQVRGEGEIAAYARIYKHGLYYKEASFGRVIVKEKYRREGLGKELLTRAIAFLQEDLNEQNIKIQAQDYLREFYGSFGFKPISEVYLEDNIPHVDMLLSPED